MGCRADRQRPYECTDTQYKKNIENTGTDHIAYGYLVFAVSQIAVLLLLDPTVFNPNCLPLAAVATATYLTVGSSIYDRSSRDVYQQLITAFMVAYGVVLISVK